MLSLSGERRLLQSAVSVLALVPIVAGFLGLELHLRFASYLL